jgi:hypothetical protein
MVQPPVPGRGAGAEPAPGAGLPGGAGGRRGRDPRLAGFAKDGPGDTCPPGSALVVTLEQLSGPEWRCDGAADDELIGLLGRWQAVESWAAAGKLGVVRELIRRRAGFAPGTAAAEGLPGVWDEGTEHEVAAALGISLPAADKLVSLAWTLQARLPGVGAMLAGGAIDSLRAKIIADELSVLDDERATQAEAMIVDQLAGKTPGQVGKLAAQAVCTVDPEGARRRRERAERDEARVRFWRDNGGAAALAAYGLPTDEALAAHANVNQRAGEYKKARAFPAARMDQLRVLAYLDLLNGVGAAARIARAGAEAAQGGGEPGGGPGGTATGPDSPGDGDGDRPHGGRPGDPAGGQPGGPAPSLAARANLTIPLTTLLGLADRPGAAHGLGPLDPALARDLAATAASSPHSQWCVTVTDADGIAVGHGCARPAWNRRKPRRRAAGTARGRSPRATAPARPAGTAAGYSPCPAGGSSPCDSARSR